MHDRCEVPLGPRLREVDGAGYWSRREDDEQWKEGAQRAPSLQKKKARVNGGASEEEKRTNLMFNKAQLVTLAHWVSLQYHGEAECANAALGGGFGVLNAAAWYFKVSLAVLEFDGYQGTEKVACKKKNDVGEVVWPVHSTKVMKNITHSFVAINNGKR